MGPRATDRWLPVTAPTRRLRSHSGRTAIRKAGVAKGGSPSVGAEFPLDRASLRAEGVVIGLQM
jgi:hypothetical protein